MNDEDEIVIELYAGGSLLVLSTADGSEREVTFARAAPTGGRALEAGAEPKFVILKAGRGRLRGLIQGTCEVTVEGTAAQASREP